MRTFRTTISPLVSCIGAGIAAACSASSRSQALGADGNASIASRPHPYVVERALDQPITFADGRIRTVNGLAFSPDGGTLFTADWVADRDATGRQRLRIFEWRFQGGAWHGPTLAPFSSAHTDYQPVMAPGGDRLYFQSTRPMPTAASEVLQNLWYVEREAGGWSTPRFAGDLNTAAREGYVAPLADGMLYFNSDRPGGRGLQDFYRSRVQPNGRFATPVPVPELNTEHSENDLFVDPRGRFVIFNRYIEATREIDLYIAFASGSGWGPARPVDGVNAPGWELTPSVTPDGQYFLFTRRAEIYQVDLDALLYTDDPVPGRRRRAP